MAKRGNNFSLKNQRPRRIRRKVVDNLVELIAPTPAAVYPQPRSSKLVRLHAGRGLTDGNAKVVAYVDFGNA